jgi:hypothetical protein
VLKQETTHFESVSEFDVNLEKQEALVKATASYDEVFEVIKKTGKEVSTQNPWKCTFGNIISRSAAGRLSISQIQCQLGCTHFCSIPYSPLPQLPV